MPVPIAEGLDYQTSMLQTLAEAVPVQEEEKEINEEDAYMLSGDELPDFDIEDEDFFKFDITFEKKISVTCESQK